MVLAFLNGAGRGRLPLAPVHVLRLLLYGVSQVAEIGDTREKLSEGRGHCAMSTPFPARATLGTKPDSPRCVREM